MRLTNLLLENKNFIDQLSRQFGMDKNKAKDAASELLPTIAKGIFNQAKEGNINSLLDNVSKEDITLNDETKDQTIAQGNQLLEKILGSKDISLSLVNQVSEKIDVDSSLLKQLLPIITTMAVSTLGRNNIAKTLLSKQGGALGLISGLLGKKNSSLGGLSSFLDADGDGSVLDDVLGMAKKFIK